MDALIKLSEKGGFNTLCEAKCYFLCQLAKENNYYYHHNSQIKEIKEDDNLYFSYNGKIIAKVKYVGEHKIEHANEKFPHAYKVKDILVFKNPQNIDQKLFQGQIITYIKTDEQKNKIKELVKNSERI